MKLYVESLILLSTFFLIQYPHFTLLEIQKLQQVLYTEVIF